MQQLIKNRQVKNKGKNIATNYSSGSKTDTKKSSTIGKQRKQHIKHTKQQIQNAMYTEKLDHKWVKCNTSIKKSWESKNIYKTQQK